MDAILERRSVRKFNLEKKISNEILVDLIRHGEAAGTARRQKSREYIIIENKDIIEQLSNIYVRSTMRVNECNQIIAVIGKDPSTLPCAPFEATDLALASQNIMLKAVEYGIGSCMLGTLYELHQTFLHKGCKFSELPQPLLSQISSSKEAMLNHKQHLPYRLH